MSVVLATRNRGKIREIMSILSGVEMELRALDEFDPYPEPPEEGETFRENALAKAKAAHGATGLPALADDSGLEVDALGGGPGVRSARYGGAGISDLDRCMKLLRALEGVPEAQRGARFHCTMVLYPAPGTKSGHLVTEGFLYGRIAEEPEGSNGFGYDPVFFLPERGLTVAQLALEEKNETSHRYRAAVEMKWLLVREFGAALR